MPTLLVAEASPPDDCSGMLCVYSPGLRCIGILDWTGNVFGSCAT